MPATGSFLEKNDGWSHNCNPATTWNLFPNQKREFTKRESTQSVEAQGKWQQTAWNRSHLRIYKKNILLKFFFHRWEGEYPTTPTCESQAKQHQTVILFGILKTKKGNRQMTVLWSRVDADSDVESEVLSVFRCAATNNFLAVCGCMGLRVITSLQRLRTWCKNGIHRFLSIWKCPAVKYSLNCVLEGVQILWTRHWHTRIEPVLVLRNMVLGMKYVPICTRVFAVLGLVVWNPYSTRTTCTQIATFPGLIQYRLIKARIRLISQHSIGIIITSVMSISACAFTICNATLWPMPFTARNLYGQLGAELRSCCISLLPFPGHCGSVNRTVWMQRSHWLIRLRQPLSRDEWDPFICVASANHHFVRHSTLYQRILAFCRSAVQHLSKALLALLQTKKNHRELCAGLQKTATFCNPQTICPVQNSFLGFFSKKTQNSWKRPNHTNI